MKIVRRNVGYIQLDDLVTLSEFHMHIPISIIEKVADRGLIKVTDVNRFTFIKLSPREELDFLKSVEGLIDYDEVRDLSKEEIIALAESYEEERIRIANDFNAMSLEDRKKNRGMMNYFALLERKQYALRNFQWFIEGVFKREGIEFSLPKGVELPRQMTESKKHKRLGFKKVVASFTSTKKTQNVTNVSDKYCKS